LAVSRVPSKQKLHMTWRFTARARRVRQRRQVKHDICQIVNLSCRATRWPDWPNTVQNHTPATFSFTVISGDLVQTSEAAQRRHRHTAGQDQWQVDCVLHVCMASSLVLSEYILWSEAVLEHQYVQVHDLTILKLKTARCLSG
jgi:hypothetical protein